MKKLLASLLFAATSAFAGVVGAPNTFGMMGPEINEALIPAPAVGYTTSRQMNQVTAVSQTTHLGDWRTLCNYSHMAFDDPIVYPGQPRRSHLHVFFGNTSTNANSTDATLAVAPSTCRGGTDNRSSYWVPAMVDTRSGTPVKPTSVILYYKGTYYDFNPEIFTVSPYPQGLRMIAGTAGNSGPVTGSPYQYVCIGTGVPQQNLQTIPSCPTGSQLWITLSFPRCWNGVDLDSADHKSHMAYPSGGKCPITHPVALPHLSYQVMYNVTEGDWANYMRLSSDMYANNIPGGYSMHGDYWMKWDQSIMNMFTTNIVNGLKSTTDVLGNGKQLY